MSEWRRREQERMREHASTEELLDVLRDRVCEHIPGYEEAFAAADVLEERLETLREKAHLDGG